MKCLDYFYITDEHKAFKKLKKIYNLKIFHCFVHLIRTVGSHSALAMLLRDILYSYTKDEYDENYLKFVHTYLYLYNLSKSDTRINKKRLKTRFDKVGKILGYNTDGQVIEIDEVYSPLYIRIQHRIPTTTNHAESYHQKVNTVAGDLRMTLPNRVALLAHHIMSQITQIDNSSISNLLSYIKKIIKKAKDKVKKDNNLLQYYSLDECNCKRSLYNTMCAYGFK